MDQQSSAPHKVILDFVDQILAEKNLPGTTEEVKQALREDMAEELLDQIDRAMIAALPEDSAEEFLALVENPEATEVEIQQFIVAAGVDTAKVASLTMLRFRDLYLGNTEQ